MNNEVHNPQLNESFEPVANPRPQESASELRHCPICQESCPCQARFCTQCGHEFSQDDRANNAASPPVPAGESAVQQIMVSKMTGNDAAKSPIANLPGTSTPPQEIPLPNTAPGKQCGQCNQETSEDAQFCCHCGNKVQHAPPPQCAITVKSVSGQISRAVLTGVSSRIGRAGDCELVIGNDDYVSSHHAQINQKDGKIFLEDISSSNGTWLRIRRPMELKPDDEILIGSSVLVLEGNLS